MDIVQNLLIKDKKAVTETSRQEKLLCVCRDEECDSSEGGGSSDSSEENGSWPGRKRRHGNGGGSLFDEDFFEAEFRKRRKVKS